MANYYDEQITRMNQLINYGSKNESKKSQNTSVLNQKEGADGKVYGIVAEGTKYYIKSCQKGKENLTESFDYIGGFLNRKACEYSSYTDAVKDMDMRLMTLNEDYGKRMPINEMKRSADFMDDSMIEMQEDIARHRQILENIDVIYQNKKNGIGDRNIGVPEAPKTQEFNTKVGDPFEDPAKYEANRDNQENAKDHERQGGPFKEDGGVDSEDMENADKLPTQDSNTPGDTYTKKAQYVPDNAVAAMNPSGGEIVRAKKINESIEDIDVAGAIRFAEQMGLPLEVVLKKVYGIDLKNLADLSKQRGNLDESLGADYPEYDWEEDPNGENLFPHEPEDVNLAGGPENEENHFPEENPDLGAEEFGELGDGTEDLEPEDMEGGVIMPDDDLSDDELLSRFNDDPEEEIGTPIAPESDAKAEEELGDNFGGEIAGIDDMSGVDRNNLSADVIDKVVNEIVGKFSKGKKMNMISESVAKKIIKESYLDKGMVIKAGEGPTNEIPIDYATEDILSYEFEDGTKVSDFVSNNEVFCALCDYATGTDDNLVLTASDFDDVFHYFVDQRVYELGKKEEPVNENRRRARFLKEADKKEREYYHDDDFIYGTPENRPTPESDFVSPSPLSQYMDKGSRKPNVGKNGTLDPRPGAPSYVNPDQVEYDPESDYYLQHKFELGLNDDPEADYTESGAWKGTDEKARKYATARVAKAQKELEMIGSELNIDTTKVVDIFRHALYTLQDAKNNLAVMVGVHPEMIEKFLSGNNIPFRNITKRGEDGEAFGYRDAKDTPQCIITPDGELPKDSDMEDDDKYVIGPSLKAMGFPDMTTDELRELVDDLLNWDDQYAPLLEAEEDKMRDVIDYVQGLALHQDAKFARTLNNVSTEWTSLLEDIAGLLSFSALPAEVLNKREEAANMSRARRGNGISGGYEEYDGSMLRNLHEDTTVLHNFGDHPGYRKKPMTTPANTEVAPNGARDWNDESTKGEEPFGKQIGSSAPYTDLVDAITKEVLKQIKGGLK